MEIRYKVIDVSNIECFSSGGRGSISGRGGKKPTQKRDCPTTIDFMANIEILQWRAWREKKYPVANTEGFFVKKKSMNFQ